MISIWINYVKNVILFKMVCSMNVIIKPLSNDSEQIKIVREFLFKMIKKEFGYDYVPEWHEDIIKIASNTRYRNKLYKEFNIN